MDKNAFKHIFDLYFDAIRSYIYYRCMDQSLASDIAQDTFMRVWEKCESLDESNIKALLYKITGDMLVSHFRKNAVLLDYMRHMTIEEAQILTPQEVLQFEELKGKYAQALEEMNPLQRDTFLMNREENLKYKEIAERMGISVKAVEKRMTNALQFLKSKLL